MSAHAHITGVGSYLPHNILTNAELEAMVDTSDDWIVTRTGIRERRVVACDESTSDLAVRATRLAIERAGVATSDIDLLVLGTSSPDFVFPSTACVTQAKLGLSCPAFDVMAACSSFVYALHSATSAIEAGRARTAVVVGAEAFTRLVDFSDRSTCVLFGDGAGAVVLQAADTPGVESIVLGADGGGEDLLKVPAGGAAAPITHERIDAHEQFVKMAGNEVYKFAVRVIPKATTEALELAGHTVDELRWLVPHQANKRIIDTIEERLGIDDERVYCNLAGTGNTSAASIPLALDDLYTSGRLSPGDLLGLVGFGAGLTWGAAIVNWTMPALDRKE